jgi:aldehyde:ferredoxin oxidoreductase
MVAMAHRGQALARLFNIRQGFTREDDVLPKRFEEDLPKNKGLSREFQAQLVSEYYAEQGWDENGVPKPEALRELGILEEVVALSV